MITLLTIFIPFVMVVLGDILLSKNKMFLTVTLYVTLGSALAVITSDQLAAIATGAIFLANFARRQYFIKS